MILYNMEYKSYGVYSTQRYTWNTVYQNKNVKIKTSCLINCHDKFCRYHLDIYNVNGSDLRMHNPTVPELYQLIFF